MEALKPILIVPLISTLFLAMICYWSPCSVVVDWLTNWLNTMGTTNAVILGAILGSDDIVRIWEAQSIKRHMPLVWSISSQTYAPMAAIMAAGMVPPLARNRNTISTT